MPTSLTFSIITVCRNSQATIGRALTSAHEQRGVAIEHVVVDGASSDKTVEIARSVVGEHAVVSAPDKGIYDAMNKGITRATGDIIAFLNADDLYADESVLARVARAFEQPGIDCVFGDVAYFHADQPGRIVRRYNSGRFTPAKLSWGWMPAHPATFIRRETVIKIGQFDPTFRVAGDFEYAVRAFGLAGIKYHYLPEILVMMQTGGASTGGLRSLIRQNREIVTACRKNGLPSNFFKVSLKAPAKLLERFRR